MVMYVDVVGDSVAPRAGNRAREYVDVAKANFGSFRIDFQACEALAGCGSGG